MNDIIIPGNLDILDKSIYVARAIENAVDVLRPLVYQVYTQKLYLGRFSTFQEYVESPDGLNKSPGYASKLKSVEEHYVINGGIHPKTLSGIANECLYMARLLPVSIEEQVEHARTLTRRELKESGNEHSPCEHDIIQICGKCHIRL